MNSSIQLIIRTLTSLLAYFLLAACGDSGVEPDEQDLSADITMTWVEKYVTYEQDQNSQLTVTDVHFLAEIIFDGDRDFDAISATVVRNSDGQPLAAYGGQDKRAFTNGYFYTRKSMSFDDIASLDAEHPANSTYTWKVKGPAGEALLSPIRIGGPEAETQIPAVSTIRLLQGKKYIEDFMAIDTAKILTVEWDRFEIGGPLEGTVWSDLVFVLISDCHGDVVYTAGAPGTDIDFASYEDTTVDVPIDQLGPGQEYTVFISQVNYVDHNKSHGIDQLAANSFAVELDVGTAGTDVTNGCPDPSIPAQYLWTRKTVGDEMESWPTVADR